MSCSTMSLKFWWSLCSFCYSWTIFYSNNINTYCMNELPAHCTIWIMYIFLSFRHSISNNHYSDNCYEDLPHTTKKNLVPLQIKIFLHLWTTRTTQSSLNMTSWSHMCFKFWWFSVFFTMCFKSLHPLYYTVAQVVYCWCKSCLGMHRNWNFNTYILRSSLTCLPTTFTGLCVRAQCFSKVPKIWLCPAYANFLLE